MEDLRGQLVVYAGLELAALLATTALSVFKPAGRTRWAARPSRPGALPL